MLGSQRLSAGLLLLACGGAPHRDVNIVAHEDDDLLFMNPDIQESITAGNQVRTVYVTAGQYYHHADPYWLYREEGIKAAYARMAGLPSAWTASNLELPAPGHARPYVVRELDLDGSAGRISVVFLRLPDGEQRLQALWTNEPKTATLDTEPATICPSLDAGVDPRGECAAAAAQTGAYSREDLLAVLAALLRDARADRVRITEISGEHVDDEHSDHYYTGRFAFEALRRYPAWHSLTAYRTYSIVEEEGDLSLEDASVKASIFDVYGAHDLEMCASCSHRDPGTGACERCNSCVAPVACEWPKPCSPTMNYGRARTWVKRQVAMRVESGPVSGPDGRCLTRSGAELLVAPCADAPAQQWVFLLEGAHVEAGIPREGGQIRAPDGEACLGNATEGGQGASIGITACPTFARPSGVAQRWRLDAGQLRVGGTSLCLGLAGDDTRLALHECSADPQRWRVPFDATVPASPPRAPICFP